MTQIVQGKLETFINMVAKPQIGVYARFLIVVDVSESRISENKINLSFLDMDCVMIVEFLILIIWDSEIHQKELFIENPASYIGFN